MHSLPLPAHICHCEGRKPQYKVHQAGGVVWLRRLPNSLPPPSTSLLYIPSPTSPPLQPCEVADEHHHIRPQCHDAFNVGVMFLGKGEWLVATENDGHMPGQCPSSVDQSGVLTHPLLLLEAQVSQQPIFVQEE